MKFDAPEESSENSTNEDTEGQSNEENSEAPASPSPKIAKKPSPVLAASKFGNSFNATETSNSTTTKPKSTLLRPSALSSVTTSATTAAASAGPSKVIQPAKLNNPFTKVTNDAVIDGNGATNDGETGEGKSDNETKVENSKNYIKKCTDVLPKFLPLVTTPKDNESSVNLAVASNSSTSSFVFGQNLKERVTVSSDSESSGVPNNTFSGFSKVMFGNPVPVSKTTTNSTLTLTEAAQELEEANRANKRKYSQVTPLTGEEGETNVLQINCKLFAFDKATSSWQERGRGTLRLNDRDEESRLVGRASGTQRLILNTKVWPGMTAERAGPKSLRLTAMDVQGDLKIFIVQAAPKEVDQLHSLLLQRVKKATERQPKKLATDH
ncbi:ran-binding protein 3-like isoform X2 [Venturia canescens]|nr:ran-binding protein 3-like isoform X2 [Venturia canescens]